jgi:hypothetical protein
MRRSGFLVLIALLILPASVARATTTSCSASEALEFGVPTIGPIGSRHCGVTLTCASGTCNWRLTVSVSGVGTVHGYVDGTVNGGAIDCSGVNSCTASRTLALTSGQSRSFECFMQADIVAVNETLTCTGQTV